MTHKKVVKQNKWLSKTLYLVLIFCFVMIPSSYAQAVKTPKVALVMKSLSNPFFFKMEEGAKKYATEKNIPLEVFGVQRETDVEEQITIVENLILRGFDAIVIAPANSIELVPICKKAMDKNIIVINIDNPFHKTTMEKLGISIPFVGSDNYKGAAMVGDYIKDKLNGHGRVAVIEGIRGNENADLRRQGFIDTVTDNSSIEVVASENANWHTSEALSKTTEILKRQNSIDAIFCANDSMALGALQALDLMDMNGKIIIGGYDNIQSVREEMRNGRIHATVEQHPELMGKFGVKLAWEALKGKKIPLHKTTPLSIITHESFDKTIAISISNLENPYFADLLKGAQDAARLFGTTLVYANAQKNDARQLTDISTFLNKKTDLLIVNPTNSQAIVLGIEMANQKNVPVITVDRKSAEGKILCHIESDNVSGGRMAARILAQEINNRGNVIELEGIPETSATIDRGFGFNDELKKFSQIKIIARESANFDGNEAEGIMKALLQKQVPFDAVFAHNDAMIIGALNILEKLKPNEPKILIGFDGIKSAVMAVKQGKLAATISQRPYTMGYLTIESAIQFFKGIALPPFIPVNLAVISK